MKKGISIIELILAVALFGIFVLGIATAVISGFDNNRRTEEEAIATAYATEGLEAVRSIRNQNYTNLVNSAGTGVIRSGIVWAFSGANNTNGKYTRVITVSSVNRDGSGNIVASGGTLDADTKKVTVDVNWNYSVGRANNISLISYLTNWKKTTTPTSCATYCVSLGTYSTGTCRGSNSACVSNGEVRRSGGNIYCTVNPNRTCCCKV